MPLRPLCRAVLFLVLVASAWAANEADLAQRAAALHERIFTLDTHLDTPSTNLRRPGWDLGVRHDPTAEYSQCDLPRMRAGGLDGGFFAIYQDQGPRTPEGRARARDAALRMFVRIHEAVGHSTKECSLALTADDGLTLAASGRRAIYVSIENGYAIGEDLSLLTTFHELGARIFGFVHNGNNDLADSIRPQKAAEWNGLSPLGRAAVVECNRVGLIIDASHASDVAALEMIERSVTPVILSHSGCRAVHNQPRNAPDEVLRALAARGGVIQLNMVPGFLAKEPVNAEYNAARARLDALHAGRALSDAENAELNQQHRKLRLTYFPQPLATLDDFLKHVFHAIDLVGIDHVGIGSDLDGGGGVVGINDVTDYPKITLALLQRGLSEADIAKFWGGNLLRVFHAVEDHAKAQKPTAVAPGATTSKS
jgi:membrane dipeptidase